MSFDLSTARPVEGMVVVQADTDTSSTPPPQPSLERAVYGTLGAGAGAAAGLYQVREPIRQAKLQRIAAEEAARESARIKAQEAAQALKEPFEVPSRKIPGGPGGVNYTLAMSDVPYAIASQAKTMDKRSPFGGQYLINQDVQNTLRQIQAGEPVSRYGLTTQGSGQVFAPKDVIETVAAEKAALAQQLPKRSGLEQITEMYQNMMRKIPTPVKALGPVAGGLGAGLDVVTLKEQMALPPEQRDLAKIISAAMGLTGGALSLTGAGLIPGMALSLGAMPVEYIMRKARESEMSPGERFNLPVTQVSP